MTFRLRYAVRSHVGNVREGNEDSAFAGSRLAVVADGMGGHAAGEVASSAAISALAHLDEDEAGVDLLDTLAAAVQDANEHLRDMVASEPALDGMGTTLTVLLASGSRLGVAHVGDSRAYLLRNNELTLVTHDQTLVQRMVDEGRITLEQAEHHPRRALLTQALDGREGVEPDLSLRELRRGDRYLLCSDGLSGVVHEETMAETLKVQDPDTAAERLIELALKGGGPDNVTVVIVDVVDEAAGLSDTPIIAGAAAEQDSVPGAARLVANSTGGHLASAAEKARRLLPGRRRSGAAASGHGAPPGTSESAGSEPADSRPVTSQTATPDLGETGADVTGYHRIPDLQSDGASPPTSSETPLPGTAPPGELPAGDTAPTDASPAETAPREATAPPPGGGGQPPTLVDIASGENGAPSQPNEDPDPDAGRRVGRKRRWVIAAIAAVVVLVLLGAFAFTRTQWYVAESNGRVALFQGLKSRPLGIPLSSVEKVYLPVTCLEPVDRTRVSNGYVAKSRADAQRFIDTLPTLPSSSDTGPRLPPDSRPAGKRPAAPPVGAIAPADCRTVGGK